MDVDEVTKKYVKKINTWIQEGKKVLFRGKELSNVELVKMTRRNTVYIKVHVNYKDETEEVLSIGEFMKKQIKVT